MSCGLVEQWRRGEEEEDGEVSSINGLPFCSPARQFAFVFYYRFFIVNFHFAGAMILSRSFWGSLGGRGRRLVSGKRHGRLDLPLTRSANGCTVPCM
jgi:hypothetical protein